MSPSLIEIRRLTIFIAVVLPLPDGPMSTQISPASTLSDSARTAGAARPGYRLVTARNSIGAAVLPESGSAMLPSPPRPRRYRAAPLVAAAILAGGLGPELLLRPHRDSAEPLRAQLEGELRQAIRARRLAAGERFPSSRRLAQELGVSRGLVQECHAQLLAEGFLSARAGSGTHVAAGAAYG